MATHRIFYELVTHLNEPTSGETHQVVTKLPNTRNIMGVTIHYIAQPTTKRWYSCGSKGH